MANQMPILNKKASFLDFQGLKRELLGKKTTFVKDNLFRNQEMIKIK